MEGRGNKGNGGSGKWKVGEIRGSRGCEVFYAIPTALSRHRRGTSVGAGVGVAVGAVVGTAVGAVVGAAVGAAVVGAVLA